MSSSQRTKSCLQPACLNSAQKDILILGSGVFFEFIKTVKLGSFRRTMSEATDDRRRLSKLGARSRYGCDVHRRLNSLCPRPGQLKGPPLYTLEKIRTLNETGGNKSIQSDRFVIVFNFRSGDRVALDVSVDKGAVYYIGDTQEHDSAGQLPAVKAFPSIRQLVDASFSDDEVFPESYMEALGRLK